jgi:glucosamine 6-phosphate synthetase-like amidotransferase/phosphosugar isomerase protein
VVQGSFGLAVCCTLDPDRVVLAALNQPLSVGLAPAQRAVLYSSEAQSLKVSPQRNTEATRHSCTWHPHG